MTRRLLLLLCLCPLLIAAASAYIVTIDAPQTLTAGEPLIVNGTSTLPPGYTHDLVLYSGPAERARTTIVVQQGGTFSARFDTTGLPTGDYRVELVPPADPGFFGTASVTKRTVTIVDRSAEVTVTSPAAQNDTNNLTVAGTAPGKKSGSIAIAVTGPGNFTFGPEYVRTDANGAFSKSVPIRGAGQYQVALSDPAGLITRYTVTVSGQAQATTTVTVPQTAVSTAATSAVATTPVPVTTAPTRAGLSPLIALGAGLVLLLLARRR
ncbi:MAG: hypothetical protein ABFC89_04455 [Methanospirillum sp.]